MPVDDARKLPGLEGVKPIANMMYVIYSEKEGVYLGNGIWSRDVSASKPANAEVFTSQEVGDKIAELTSTRPDIQCRPAEVYPSHRAAALATQDDCANAGLPRWST